ncbi:E3 ubiquitin-protein ligase RNF170 [Bombina bombina]|uniref:E3 ubiquitin-protein ligase RNF170 n=1 Tax=Bombina bombina TaxID=8345 RepID=UPI00235AC718|nr:E3 ubiquitin-protein ligase RNF170 [Bombina bombina]
MLSHTFCPTSGSSMNKLSPIPQQIDNGKKTTSSKKDIKCRQPRFHSDLNCPVCLQTAILPVETNCGHLFCGPCLMAYWKHDPWLGPVSCPLCRQKVILLYNDFCEHQQDEISRDINHYNKCFSGKPRPCIDYLYDLPSLLHLALRRIFTIGGLVWIFCLRVVLCSFGAVMCLSSTFDVIPDSLCGILSAIDDLVVVFLLLICMINICQQLRSEGIHMGHSTIQSNLSES